MKTNFTSDYFRAKVKGFLSFCQWPYGDICSISPVGKGQGTEFNLTFRKGSGKKSETLKFSTEHRTELLTEALVRPPICLKLQVSLLLQVKWLHWVLNSDPGPLSTLTLCPLCCLILCPLCSLLTFNLTMKLCLSH